MKCRWSLPAIVLLIAGMPSAARAELQLAGVFSDGMVLQRSLAVPVWGIAAPNVAVKVEFSGQSKFTKTDASGQWSIRLDPLRASDQSKEMIVSAEGETFRIADVVVGEVWLCSGQSNMEWPVAKAANAAKEIASAVDPLLRHLRVHRRASAYPRHISADWRPTNPQSAPSFSAVAYYFARELRRELKVPVGVICSAWGGTMIDPWIPPVGFELKSDFADITEKLRKIDPANVAKETRAPNQQTPAVLFHGMIHDLAPYAIRGVLWYQGESDRKNPHNYDVKMEALVGGWREVWGQAAFPFYYVQIAPHEYRKEPALDLPAFWEAQTKALRIPNTGMVVTNDIGNLRDIHPGNKQEVGRRLTLLALKRTYGRRNLVDSGPTFLKCAVEANTIRVSFDNIGSGLISRDGKPLSHFEIAGANDAYVPATAAIDRNTVVLFAEGLKDPTQVRFGWSRTAVPNLGNAEGLPARAFRASVSDSSSTKPEEAEIDN